jgi:hypothetical protein
VNQHRQDERRPPDRGSHTGRIHQPALSPTPPVEPKAQRVGSGPWILRPPLAKGCSLRFARSSSNPRGASRKKHAGDRVRRGSDERGPPQDRDLDGPGRVAGLAPSPSSHPSGTASPPLNPRGGLAGPLRDPPNCSGATPLSQNWTSADLPNNTAKPAAFSASSHMDSCYFSRVSRMPEAASFRLAPWVVLVSSITTPFWFFMIVAPAPPPTVAPAPAAV